MRGEDTRLPHPGSSGRGNEGTTVTADTCHLVWIAPISWDGIPGTDRAMAQTPAATYDAAW